VQKSYFGRFPYSANILRPGKVYSRRHAKPLPSVGARVFRAELEEDDRTGLKKREANSGSDSVATARQQAN